MTFQIQLPIEELRKRKLFLGCPMYGGQCYGSFARSAMDLASICVQHGITLYTYFLFNESLITRARAYACDEFMRSDATHMIFIDSDIGFNPNDVIAMLAMQNPDPTVDNYDVVAGPYPKKCIAWEKVKVAVDKGYGDENPNELSKFIGDFVFNPVEGNGVIQLGQPTEVGETGTGFMMIRRATFEKFAAAYPELSYKPDHVRTEHFDGSREIMMYFDTVIDPETKRYLSEDYFFCKKLRKIGGHVWLLPWIKLSHTGTYIYDGSLADVGALNVSVTADAEVLEKTKNRGKKGKK
jgi:hypothetical protein